MRLFVYGTLRQGASNPCERFGGKYLYTTTLTGAVLFSLGGFPGLRFTGDDNDVVFGDVYEVDQSIINRLDMYEGYSKVDLNGSFYIRKTINITIGDVSASDVEIYEYNAPSWFCLDRYPIVDGGDWLKHAL